MAWMTDVSVMFDIVGFTFTDIERMRDVSVMFDIVGLPSQT